MISLEFVAHGFFVFFTDPLDFATCGLQCQLPFKQTNKVLVKSCNFCLSTLCIPHVSAVQPKLVGFMALTHVVILLSLLFKKKIFVSIGIVFSWPYSAGRLTQRKCLLPFPGRQQQCHLLRKHPRLSAWTLTPPSFKYLLIFGGGRGVFKEYTFWILCKVPKSIAYFRA